MKNFVFLISFIFFPFMASIAQVVEPPPMIYGHGKNTIGGHKGVVIWVTNLKDHGPGSLREAVSQTFPRYIMFKVSGDIHLESSLLIQNPFVTIAGQSSPGLGITLRNNGILINAHEVILQHLRVRLIPDVSSIDEQDGVKITTSTGLPNNNTDVYNVVLDHLSVSWASDENISTWNAEGHNLHSITIQHSIISEGLTEVGHVKGRHSMGLLVGDNTKKISIVGNLFANNYGRNPLFKSGSSGEVSGNMIFNSGYEDIGFSTKEHTFGPIQVSIINNFFGPRNKKEKRTKHIRFWSQMAPGTEIYLAGNSTRAFITGQLDLISPKSINFNESFKSISDKPLNPEHGPLINPAFCLPVYLLLVGAKPLQRDRTDIRLIGNTARRDGEFLKLPPADEL